jgi:hypothetical protein
VIARRFRATCPQLNERPACFGTAANIPAVWAATKACVVQAGS